MDVDWDIEISGKIACGPHVILVCDDDSANPTGFAKALTATGARGIGSIRKCGQRSSTAVEKSSAFTAGS